jgi:hypothetical protein
MKISAPIYHLKRKAKALSRENSIPLHAALNHIALQEGCSSWSLLAARHAESSPAATLYRHLKAGELLLIGARPGLGKTLMALELAIEAMKAGKQGFFFTLDYTARDILDRFRSLSTQPSHYSDRFTFDCSDGICADHIIDTLGTVVPDTLAVIDYLQLLDQRRENPPLAEQIDALKSFARDKGLIFVFVSQIDRNYDPARKAYPDLEDIRLPNPVNLAAFDRTCFLNDGGVRFQAAS